MRDSMVSQETWSYECRGCQHDWQQPIEVRYLSDGHGGDVVVYRRNGHPCISPWTELCCPSCGGYDVTVLPMGRPQRQVVPRQRHGELEMIFRLRRMHAY